jgi:hypothetical protein
MTESTTPNPAQPSDPDRSVPADAEVIEDLDTPAEDADVVRGGLCDAWYDGNPHIKQTRLQ